MNQSVDRRRLLKNVVRYFGKRYVIVFSAMYMMKHIDVLLMREDKIVGGVEVVTGKRRLVDAMENLMVLPSKAVKIIYRYETNRNSKAKAIIRAMEMNGIDLIEFRR